MNTLKRWFQRFLAGVLVLACLHIHNLQAQEAATTGSQPSTPVMRSVFWNTVWGSGWGAVMGISYHLFSGIKFRETVITGTTIGGALGYGLGIYLVLNGFSFDKRYLLELPAPEFGPRPSATNWKESDDFLHARKDTSPPGSFGWEATVFEIRF